MKILIIRFSSIGDIVLTSPVPRIAKTQLGAEVHYVTKIQFRSLIDKNPFIDKIYTIKSELNEITNELKSENYDFIIDLHNSLRSKILKFKLGIKSFTVDKKNIKKWLMVKFKSKIVIPHIVDRYLETLKNLGGINDGKGLDFYYTKTDELFIQNNIPSSYICISLGAKHFTKKIPSTLIKKLIINTKNNIILIGGNDTIEESIKIEKALSKSLINLVGKLNISESAQIIDNSILLITADTGMMHIAAALKKKIIVIWGSTVPEFGMYPYYGDKLIEHTNFEVNNLNCRPCSKIGFDKCPKSHFNCMNNHDTKTISNTIEQYSS